MELKRNLRKERIGHVVSNKPDKTIIVRIDRKVKHSLYGKYIKKSTKLMAHDPKNACQEGDRVKIGEIRPLSKNKRWRLIEVLNA